ncbi:PEPxxWA-CTERM sorting domain-containing protein [Sphingomonas sp.]|uniref:PEPxxWA-CTERM sorting domain-containing protein n=1 Tax=Sphingomonas sp. TaxID=28214 RepID=UPI002DB71784|nr:PEPxxWA-CTERM sorting domain-containing protein [Sphingomonas sp.]HEU4969975.1 PEPxxWA-CTERM sorting domain-containing protein [Sphingomonas sp.]
MGTSAAAETIDFEDTAAGLNGLLILQGDYQFTAFSSMAVHTSSGSKALFGPNPFDFSRPTSVTLSRDDGAAFNFIALDVFAADSNGLGVPLTFFARYADGRTDHFTFDLPSFSGATPIPQTRVALAMPDLFRGVTEVSWSNGAVWHQVDNIVVTSASAAPVPEPASWALMIGGFALAGAELRRSSRKSPAVAA